MKILLSLLLTFALTPASFGQQREAMWISLDEQVFEHLRLAFN
jgi:hypothetical protein